MVQISYTLENSCHMFCIKTCDFIVSDTIQPVPLPPISTTNTFVGEIALLSGFGSTTQSKFSDAFNLYSTDKKLLFYWKCHMDLFEVTYKYVIWNPTVTLLNEIRVWVLCCYCMVKAVLEQVKYSGVTSTGKTVGCPGHKCKLGRSEVLTGVLLIPQIVWNICCVDC